MRKTVWIWFICFTGFLALSAIRPSQAQSFRITDFVVPADGGVRLRHEANTNSYYILLRGDDLSLVSQPIDLRIGFQSESELTDGTDILDRAGAFYRVQEIPLDTPVDTDSDGIDDVYELRQRQMLDPLDRVDAFLDFDGDGHSNLKEYQEGTDPVQANPRAAVIIETSPMPGDREVNVTRETILRFSGPIVPSTITTNSFYLTVNGIKAPGTVRVSSTQRFATFFNSTPLPSATEVSVVVEGDLIRDGHGLALDADGDGRPGGTKLFRFLTLPLSRIPGTRVFGYVRDSFTQAPIEGVTIRVDAFPEANAITDNEGRFELADMPAPVFFVHIDGSTVTNVPLGWLYPSVGKPFHSVPGRSSQLNHHGQVFDVYLPLMAMTDVRSLSATETNSVGFGPGGLGSLTNLFPELNPEVFGRLAVHFAPGTAFDESTMAVATQAVIVPVPPNRIPSPLPPDVNPKLVISIQALGATSFDVPVRVTFPNLEGFPPGGKATLWSFDHDAGHFMPMGNMTVSADGLTITTDPGVGALAPGWHFVSDPRNWTGPDRPPGEDSGEPEPTVDVRWVIPGSGEGISFRFSAPAGPPEKEGEHVVEGKLQRRVTVNVTGPFNEFFNNEGEKRFRNQTFVLAPGDPNLELEADVRSLEEIEEKERDGRKFGRDRIYGAIISVRDETRFPDGSSIVQQIYVAPFAYVDVSDGDDDGQVLEFPDLLVGRSQKRAFELARGVPAHHLIVEGAGAAHFEATNGELSFKPTAPADEWLADLKLRVRVESEFEDSMNALTLRGRGMTPQRLALNKAQLEAVLAELVRTNDRYQLSYTNDTGSFTLSFAGSVTGPIPAGASANSVFAAVSQLATVGVGNVHVQESQNDAGEPAIQIELTGFLDEIPLPLGISGTGANLVPLVRNELISTNEMALIDTPEERRAIANQVEARIIERLGILTDGLTVVDLPGTESQTIEVQSRLGGVGGLLGRAISGVEGNDNLGFQALLNGQHSLRTNQVLFSTDLALNTVLTGTTILFPDLLLETTRAGDLGGTNSIRLIHGLAKTILHETGHTLGAAHVYKEGRTETNIISPNGVPGFTDIMRSGFDMAVSSLALQPGISFELFKLALNLDYTLPEAGRVFNYLAANFTYHTQFDADGPDPNDTKPFPGALLILRQTSGSVVLGELDFGNVLVDGVGGTRAVIPLELTSVGQEPVTLTGVALEPPSEGFAIDQVSTGTVLTNGQSLFVNLSFDPTARGAAGTRLRILSSNTNAPIQTYFIAGFGLVPNPVVAMTFEDDLNNFGGVELGRSGTNKITIVNRGAANLVFTLSSTRRGDFHFSGFDGVPQELAFGQSIEIPAVFTPTRLGLARQSFSLLSNDPEQPTVNATLVGTGINLGGVRAADAEWGDDYVVVERNNFAERLRSNTDGNFMNALPVFSPYTVSIFDPASGYLAGGTGISGAAAAYRGITGGLAWQASDAPDSDGDGLPDDIEHAIGTSVAHRDTDGDGMDDFTEIMQGLNPADGVATPVGIIGSLDLPGVGRDVEVATFVDAHGREQDLAFVVLSESFGGLFIADVSNPQFPIALASLALPVSGSALDVEVDVARRQASLAVGGGIYAVDVSDPRNPVVVAASPNTPATSLESVEDRIYANSSSGIRVLDAVTLDELRIIPVPVTDLDYDNGYLYAVSGGQLRIMDVRNPEAPVARGSVELGAGAANDVFVGNGLAIVAAAEGPRVVDVSNPENPRRLDDGDSFPENFGITLNGSGLALSARDNFGVSLFGISNPTSITSLLNLNTGGPRDVRLHEGLGVAVGFRAFSGSLGVLTTLNYLPFDAAGQPPTLSLTAEVTDVDPVRPGLQVSEGTPIPVRVAATDDLQVRRVELLVNGLVAQVDASFPFNFTTLVPPIVGQTSTLTLQAKASDMGLAESATGLFVIEVLADVIPPVLVASVPAEGAAVFAPAALSLSFSEILDAASLNVSAASLLGLGADKMPGGGDDIVIPLSALELRGFGQRLAVVPAALLAPGNYRLVINSTAIRDLVGNPIIAPLTLNFTVRPALSIVAASGTPADPNAPSLNVGQTLILQSDLDPRLIHVKWSTLDAVGNPGVLVEGANEQNVDDANGTADFTVPDFASTGELTIFGSSAENITKLRKWDVTSGAAMIRGEDSQGGQANDRFPGNGLYVHWRALEAGHTLFAMQTREVIDLEPGAYELSFSAHGFGDFANRAEFTVSLGTIFSESFAYTGASTVLSNLTRTVVVSTPGQVRLQIEESGGGAFNAGTVDNFRLTRLSDSRVIFEDDFSLGFMDDTFLLQIVPTLSGGNMTSTTSEYPGGAFRLSGSGFTEGDFSVRFGDAVLTDMNLVGSPDVTGENDRINLIVPLDAEFGPITVLTAGGTSAPLAVRLDQIAEIAPRGTPANPALASANVGQSITLRGQGFTPQTDFFLPRIGIAGNLSRRLVRPSSVNAAGSEATLILPDDVLTGAIHVPGSLPANAPILQVVPTLELASADGGDSRIYLLGSGFVEGSGAYVLGPNPGQTVLDQDVGTAVADVISLGGPNRAVRLPSAPAFTFGQVIAIGPGGSSESVPLNMFNPALARALFEVAVDAASGDYFVAAGGANSFVRRLTRTGTPVTDFDIPDANVVDQVGLDILPENLILNNTALNAGALIVFNGESNPNSVAALNPVTGETLASVNISADLVLRGGVYDPTTQHFFVIHTGSPNDFISEVNPANGSVIRTFAIEAQTTLGGLELDPETGHFWVATSQRTLQLVSRADGSLQRTLDLSDQILGNVMTGLAIDTDGQVLVSSIHGVVFRFGLGP